jgi:hypothetical protein
MSAVTTIEEFGRLSGVFDFMNTAWAWPMAESLHFIGLSLLLGTIGIVDLRLLGFAKAIPVLSLHKIARFAVAGFAINVLTGSAFFVSAPDQYLYNPAFQLKAACMLIAVLNVAVFYAFVWPRIRGSEGRVPFVAWCCGLISLTAWLGVITFGRLITFYRPPEHWCFWC